MDQAIADLMECPSIRDHVAQRRTERLFGVVPVHPTDESAILHERDWGVGLALQCARLATEEGEASLH
jgi:hypothetical protein